ncbi:hypothetical protein NQZ68_000740 [Dissostichus eleginoides]|nr:hypothetical protein NQZ68_000740 [Dissostichus eleginoides]
MAEVSAIINARPLTTISTDAQAPSLLTSAMILTQKIYIASNGEEYSTWPTAFGKGRGASIFLHSRVALSGKSAIPTFSKETWCFLVILR